MSAAGALVAAVLAQVEGAAGAAGTMMVFDAPPVRHRMPYAVIEEPVLAAYDAAGVTGRTGTLAITFRDVGERPVRLRELIASTEALVEGLPTQLDDGWRLGGIVLTRSRLTHAKDGWAARSEWAVRIFRAN